MNFMHVFKFSISMQKVEMHPMCLFIHFYIYFY